MRTRLLLPTTAVLLAAVLAACSSGGPPPVTDATKQALEHNTDWTWQKQANRLELGVTHAQDSLDPEEPPASVDRGKAVLRDNGAIWQNQHLMGFGTLNPEPSPGDFQWASLDRRMQLIKDTGGRTVLTLCCSPDWMKGGQAGSTDWSRIEAAPQPEHFDDFAALAAKAVERYPQIERVLVWNELKGFYSESKNRWDYEGYTELYNKVYTAVKAVRPDVQIGGPYAVLIGLDPGAAHASTTVSGPWGVADQRTLDIVEYWLAHNVGADFIAVDGATQTRSSGTVATPADKAAQKYADFTTWIRERTGLAIWWAEFYPDVPKGTTGGGSQPASAASTLAAVAAYAQSGVSIALLWGPQGSSLAYASLWTDATKADGGQPTPLTAAWQWLVPRLAAGKIEIGRSPTLPLLALRAPDGMVVVNLTGQPVPIGTGGVTLPAWAVTLTGPAT